MEQSDIQFSAIPSAPGIYLFRGARKKVLYIGRATKLRSRVRSYFSSALSQSRGPRMEEAVKQARSIETIPTESILDAYILEANLIKKYQPPYNVAAKDNTSFLFVVFTREAFPRIQVIRGRELQQQDTERLYTHIYGPFPKGSILKEALRIIRKIFPYRSDCTPFEGDSTRSNKTPRKCLRAELHLCPGMCAGLISRKEYQKRIRDIALFFEGKKKKLIASLEREMKMYARKMEFEKAEIVKRRKLALTHIQDAQLIRKEFAEGGETQFRIEGYDVAHISGKQQVGVMVVSVGGEKDTKAYRTFNIRESAGDDISALREILTRRIRHQEWQYPDLIVVDGGTAHLRAARSVLMGHDISIPVVAVVKDDRHRARQILGAKEYAHSYESDIVAINQEAHRFAVTKHRQKRKREMFLP